MCLSFVANPPPPSLSNPPGYTMVTLPGVFYHGTVSLGFSVAEAASFEFQMPDAPSLEQRVAVWRTMAGLCGKVPADNVNEAIDARLR